jgi:hypothetical protein
MTLISFRDFDEAIDEVIQYDGPMGVSPKAVKRELAMAWLGRPEGFWAWVKWAWRLTRDVSGEWR